MRTTFKGIVYESTPEEVRGSCMGCDLKTSSGGCLAQDNADELSCFYNDIIWFKVEAAETATIVTDHSITFTTGKTITVTEKEFDELKKLFGNP